MSYIIVEHGGARHRVPIACTHAGVWVGWPGGAAPIEPERKQVSTTATPDDKVVAPMTGKVIELRVRVGETVRADDVVAILEAMKMEYRLPAPRDGTVVAVGCAVGELVDLGATLVALGPEAAPPADRVRGHDR
jgi:acetyl/propionyl-CoA carboxylase alpha subunit